VRDGRFGPYVTDGVTNADIPRGEEVEAIDFERASSCWPTSAPRGPVKPKSSARSKRAPGEEGLADARSVPHLRGRRRVGQVDAVGAADRLADEQGHTVVHSREPGGSDFGLEVRELVLHRRGHIAARAEALLYAADRAHNIATVVRPALERGDMVIQDRYLDSSVAYQGAGRVLDPQEVRDTLPMGDEEPPPRPHGAARPRRGNRTYPLDESRTRYDRLEAESDDFHARVRAGYLALAAAEPQRFLVLDATLPVDELAARIRDRVSVPARLDSSRVMG
jgi:dTMP kinase